MSDSPSPDVGSLSNEPALHKLAWAIAASQGQFALMLARCNYASLRDSMIEQLHELCSVEIRELTLKASDNRLYTTIREKLTDEQPAALMVSGLESVSNLDPMLTAMNQVREEFRKTLPFPLVLWVNDEVLKKLIRLAPDFHNWGALTEFCSTLSRLTEALNQRKDKLFDQALEADGKQFSPNAIIFGPSYQHELKSALTDLQSLGQALEPELQATLDFALGRDDYVRDQMETALSHYLKSLVFWRLSPAHQARQGILLFHIGLCHFRQAEQHDTERRVYLEKARQYFQQAIDSFEQAKQPELVAKYINQLGETLQHLGAWKDLYHLAQKSLMLQKDCQNPIQLAQAHGFLAEVALQKAQAEEANQAAQAALDIITRVAENQEHYQNLYLLLQARSLKQQPEQAIASLERARKIGPQGKPQLYIRVLNLLRTLYFQQKRYLAAFQVKQERRSIEQQYGLRAFVGAGRLKPQRQARSTLVSVEQPVAIAQEIAVSSRRQDVERLISRIAEPRHKLTVIYGQSGVGKSSLVESGLVPALKQQQVIGARDVVPILLRSYPHWIQDIGEQLGAAVEETALDLESPPKCDLLDVVLDQLQQSEPRNVLSVLIFDQFEEFFFVCESPAERQLFFEFFRDCLDIPCVKVILSMREDYLHHLLRQGGRSRIPLNAINNNILDKDILYYLGNFSAEDAQSIIVKLTERAQFALAVDLVDELVRDLTDELGEVQPIELQIVGEQLQAENITTLAQYRERGPKEQLVQRYLETVMADCGAENHQLAELVLYLLTDENHTRPLKTRSELETDLRLLPKDLSASANKLDLVLNILVKSGLVLQLPEMPTVRYQLVHDYLVVFIRQQEEPKLQELAAELEKERKQRKRSEEQLNRVLRQRLRISIATGFGLAILSILTGTFALESTFQRKVAENSEIEVTISEIKDTISDIEDTTAYLEEFWEFNQDFKALIASLKVLDNLRQIQAPISAQFTQNQKSKLENLRRNAEKVLQKSVYRVSERNRLEGHAGTIFSVSFSPDGQRIATASGDNTIKLWSLDGRELQQFTGHDGEVYEVSFSPDGQTLATASADKTVKLWNLDGEELQTLVGHDEIVHSVSFSPDGQTLATASEDKTAKLWSLDGQALQTLRGHEHAVLEVSFSPDGQTLATASFDQTAKLWNLAGQELQTLTGHKDGVFSVSFSPDGQTIATGSQDKTAKLWNLAGKELKTLAGHRNTITNVEFSPNGQTIMTASTDETVNVWGYDGQYLQTLAGHDGWVWSVGFSPEGQTLATASADNTVKLWRLNPQNLLGHQSLVHDVSFSPDGQTIATASEDNTVKLWRVNAPPTARYQRSLVGHLDEIRAVSFSPVAPIIATASNDKTVKIWNLEGQERQTFFGHQDLVVDVSFSPDGQTIATASKDKTAKLWNLAGQELQTLTGHTAEVIAVRFSPDGQTIATASWDGTAKLWSLKGKELATLTGHVGLLTDVSFGPDSQTIATASYDGVAKLWNLKGEAFKTLKGHARTVSAVRFSPNGETIATASWDQTIKLWNRQGEVIDTLYGHDSAMRSLSFSPDGQLIVSSDTNGRVILWNWAEDLNDLWARGCDWVRDYLQNNPKVEKGDRTLCDNISF